MFLLRMQLNKIMYASNKNVKMFVLKYGILQSMIFVVVISLTYELFHFADLYLDSTWIDIGIKTALSIIPGFFIGLGEYILYCETIQGIEVKKKLVKYVGIIGFLGWGVLCSILNSKFYPFDINNILFPFILLPGYALIIGNLTLILFNPKTVKDLYEFKFKGKKIAKIMKRSK